MGVKGHTKRKDEDATGSESHGSFARMQKEEDLVKDVTVGATDPSGM